MNVPIWEGSSSFQPGQTPFGFYDADTDFITDADNMSDWCAKRLGYPLVDIELQDVHCGPLHVLIIERQTLPLQYKLGLNLI